MCTNWIDERAALLWAACGSYSLVLQCPLDHGVTLEAYTEPQDRTALFSAVARIHLSTVEFLVDKRANVNANGRCWCHSGAKACPART